MRTGKRLQLLETRLGELEGQADQFRGNLGQIADKAHIELGKQLLELSDLGTRLGRQLAIRADRIALMIIKSDTAQMGIEHLDLIQGDIQATLREHTTLLGKILTVFRSSKHICRYQLPPSPKNVRGPR